MARGIQGEETAAPEVSAEDAFPRRVTPHAEDVDASSGIRQAGAQAGAAIGNLVDRKLRTDGSAWAAANVSDFRVQQLQKMEAAKQSVGMDVPDGFTPNYLKQYDADAQKLIKSAGMNPYARAITQQALSETRTSFGEHMVNWEAAQRKAGQDQALQSSLDKSGVVARAHPDMAEQLGGTLMDQIRGSADDPVEKHRQAAIVDRHLTEQAALGLSDQNPNGVYEQLKPGGTVTDPLLQRLNDPAARAHVFETAQGHMVQQTADGIAGEFRNGGWEQGGKAFTAFESSAMPQDMKDKVRAESHTLIGQLVQERQQQYGDDMQYVEQQLRGHNPAADTRARILGLRDHMALERNTAGSMLGELDALHDKRGQETPFVDMVQDARDHGTYLDAKDDAKAVGLWFQDATDANNIKPGSAPWVALAADVARRNGVIPRPVGSWARSVLVASNNPTEVMAAADVVDRMRLANPRAFAYFDDEHGLAKLADSFHHLVTEGISDPAQAIAIARKNAEAATDPSQRQRLDQMWAQARPLGPRGNVVQQVLEQQIKDRPDMAASHGIFGTTLPPIPTGMQAEYQQLTRDLFDYNGGDAQTAEEQAGRAISHVWGVTRMNGTPELVKYPPEGMFRAKDGTPGLSADLIREDLKGQVEQHPDFWRHWDAESGAYKPFKPDAAQLRLIPVPATQETNGVTWGVAYEDPVTHDVTTIPDKQGRPATYDLPLDRGRVQKIFQESKARQDAAAQERLKQRHIDGKAEAEMAQRIAEAPM